MAQTLPVDFVWSLVVSYLDHESLKCLSLASRSLAETVSPFTFKTLKTMTVSEWDCSPLLLSLLSEAGWYRAENVRSITVNVDKMRNRPTIQALNTSEKVAGQIIQKFPKLQHVTLTATSQSDSRGYAFPAKNFEPIARALISRSRLCTLDLLGPWLGGWTCPINLLQKAGGYLRAIHLAMCSPRDVAFCRTLCSEASSLRVLDLSGGTMRLESDRVNEIVRALPRPDNLVTFRAVLDNGRGRGAWWQELFLEPLRGLEELGISNVSSWNHTDHDNDPLVFHSVEWANYFKEAPQPLDLPGSEKTFSEFLSEHPSLQILAIQSGSNPLGSAPLPPHLFSPTEASQAGLIPSLTSTDPDSASLEAHTEWTRQNMMNVMAWAASSSKALVQSINDLSKVAPTLDMMRWWPYGEKSDGSEVCLDIFMDRDCEDGMHVNGGLLWDGFDKDAAQERRSMPKEYVVTW